MRMDVPFLADPTYIALLTELGECVESAHFGLEDPQIPDARHVAGRSAEFPVFAKRLAAFRATGKRTYALLNARFHTPETYEAGALARINARLSMLLDHDAVDGIVFADGFLLRAFADAHPDTAERLEAVPSVNCQLATPGALYAALTLIADAGFRPPSRLVPARELSRDVEALDAFRQAAGKVLPGVSVALLANEGCLPHCPFRTAHGAKIALERAGLGDAGYDAVRDLGCLRTSASQPHRLLTSPFIRPEDAPLYSDHADALKVCGRTRGPDVLGRIVRTYANGAYHGNLLDILDAAEPLAQALHVDNDALTALNPGEFWTRCKLACGACGRCEELARAAISRRAPAPGKNTLQNRM